MLRVDRVYVIIVPPHRQNPIPGAEIPVEDYRFDRSTPGIVGQEVYGSGMHMTKHP